MKQKFETDVCIVGGGPAGMILALLLSHLGVKVLVLEKNKDFAREYRGEVLMPRFSQMFQALNLKSWLDSLPHLKLKFGEIFFLNHRVGKLDFSKAAPDAPYALWMPQKILLDALHEKARQFASYQIWFGVSVKHLAREKETVTGALVFKDGEEVEVSARVTVGSDGRYSTVLKEGNFKIAYEDYKFDVLWFTIPKPENYDNTFKVLFSLNRNYLLLPKYPEAIQVGILVAPHELNEIKKDGIEKIKSELAKATPLFKEFAENLKDFTAFHPLQAHLHYVEDWAKDGCLLIGDSAHCCSPAGAIGVSVATGTAIVAAEVISNALKTEKGVLSKKTLSQVQKLRKEDVKQIHKIQMAITGGGIANLLPVRVLLPLIITILAKTPFLTFFQKRVMALPKSFSVSNELKF